MFGRIAFPSRIGFTVHTQHYHVVASKANPQSAISVSSLNFQYNLLSLRSPSSYVRLLPHPPVPSVFPSSTCFSRQFLRNLWPIRLAFFCFIVCRMFHSSLTPCNILSYDRSSPSSPSLFVQVVIRVKLKLGHLQSNSICKSNYGTVKQSGSTVMCC